MPKNIDDVIVPERRKSIRNIPIPEGRRKADRVANMDGAAKSEPPVMPPRPLRYRSTRPSGRKFWLAVLVAAVILAFAILSFFGGGTLAYTPRSATLSFAGETYSAYKTADSGLLYSVVKLSGDKALSVEASGEQEVSRKASGTIVVYNNASAEAQRLVENTRFETTEGKVYRIAQAISVPGRKTVAGTTQPGSVEAVVYADVAGPAYNVGLTDFKLPGLKGTPRYETIYARSKTPMSGGFVGKEKVVATEGLTKARTDLRGALSQELLTKAQAEVPADFILFPSLSSFEFEDLPQSEAGSGSVNLNMRGHLYGIMFKKTDLSTALARSQVTLVVGEPVEMESFETIEISFAGAAPTDLLSLNKIDFKASGSGLLLWRTDEIALKSDIAGRERSDVAQILKNYPTIESANATVRPFWKSSFPEEADSITVKQLPVQ